MARTMKKIKIDDKTRVQEFYPMIRGQLCEIDDPDMAWDFLNIAIENGVITPRKAQKMFDRRFPKETLDAWREFLVRKASELDPEIERIKKEAQERRIEAIKNLGFDPASFERKLEQMVMEKKEGA